MPNWCKNYVKFSSKENAEKVFKALEKDGVINFYDLIPPPQTKEECSEKFLITKDSNIQIKEDKPWFNWYEWNCENLGVKWEESECYLSGDSIVFDTPWGSPYNNVFQKIADSFDVDFCLTCTDEMFYVPYDYYFYAHNPDAYKEVFIQWKEDENKKLEKELSDEE